MSDEPKVNKENWFFTLTHTEGYHLSVVETLFTLTRHGRDIHGKRTQLTDG